MSDNDPIPHKHLYEVSVEVLDLSEIAAKQLAKAAMASIGDRIDFFARGADAMIDATPPFFPVLYGEVKQKLIERGYWKFVTSDE